MGENKLIILAPLELENYEENKVFTVFPNPTSEYLTIENHTRQAIKTQIILRDLNGKKILHKPITIVEKEQISLQELSAGTYFLTLETATFKISKKITKL